jgi:WD40 repeat protein
MKREHAIKPLFFNMAFVVMVFSSACQSTQANRPISATLSPAPAPTRSIESAPMASSRPSVPGAIILYARDCGLHALPSMPALDTPEMRTVYASVTDCAYEVGRYLIGAAPVLSPDGQQLIVTGPYETWLAQLQTGTLRQLLPTQLAVSWDPDSARIAYVTQDTLYVRGSTADVEPTAVFTADGLIPLFARWSPDGRWIAVASYNQANNSGQETNTFWVVSPDDRERKDLGTFPTLGTELTPDDVRWSPDSRSIATFSRWILSLDGTRKQFDNFDAVEWWTPALAGKLTQPEHDPKWAFSPTGLRLAYTRANDQYQTEVWIVEKDSGQRAQIGVIPAAPAGAIRWTPDSQTLIVSAWQQATSTASAPRSAIWSLSVKPNNEPQLLIQDAVLVDVIPTVGVIK